MEKIWFIEINGQREGPYNVYDLKRDTRITPDTLVWREGFKKWIPMRKVAELKEVFKDEKDPEDENVLKQKEIKAGKETIALNQPFDVPPMLWLLLIVFLLTYVMYWIYR